MTIEKKEPRKRFLALDTSTATLGVAVTENNSVVHEINASGERNHSVHLLPIIEQALQASGTSGNSLAGISVGVGPGSYTGTRIAVSAAKTLAWAWDIPVVGVSSLQALAWGGFMKSSEDAVDDHHAPDWIIPLLDARRGQAYTALFASNGRVSPERLAPDAIRLMQDWVQQLIQLLQQAEVEGNKPHCLWFVGETSLHASDESLELLRGITDIRAVPYELEGRWTGFLGEERHSHGSDDIHSLIPNYTQLTEAEVNLRKSTEGGSK
ncbi:tRNA (adenosine(37)-N6)-threonylcarbamoyltransferase complex dimerization subunit type 1 TsaB [Paenibacillus wynnii]|uniref:tRNA (adenosine(37)-N6)-threonylcarbamoyltransferase complex dimerization subunit type 1 TsaB n=1 Tax=Paenibacillus wynnii TaxID=268407 RepID=UPI00278FF90C|nr:tRNA (adenosine(37)-N6)-threonylcarbamoyltransferase complex dimerization subunit type 1 TsaB [Paenibacillus wynnii]MDQ0194014.1 tRNA threonylcarbamoyladenosine biosynthesis protein TsaB [Paenibacillus wynnii]